MPSRRKEDLEPALVIAYEQTAEAYHRAYPNDPQPFITCTHRTRDEQDALYAQGRTKPGKKVTNAQAGESPHNYLPSMAFDIAFIGLDKKLYWSKKYFKQFADLLKKSNSHITWGGDFKSIPDAPHFELSAWKSKIKP